MYTCHFNTLKRLLFSDHLCAHVLICQILQFLKHRRAQRSILTPLKGPKGLTDSRRTELKQHIQQHISLRPVSHLEEMKSCVLLVFYALGIILKVSFLNGVFSVVQSSVTSAEGRVELHQRAQSLLHQHLINRASDRAHEQHRQALLAQINTDLELLLSTYINL